MTVFKVCCLLTQNICQIRERNCLSQTRAILFSNVFNVCYTNAQGKAGMPNEFTMNIFNIFAPPPTFLPFSFSILVTQNNYSWPSCLLVKARIKPTFSTVDSCFALFWTYQYGVDSLNNQPVKSHLFTMLKGVTQYRLENHIRPLTN